MASIGATTLQNVVKQFGPGYMAGQKRSALAGAQQSAVSSGLSGTTRPGAVSAGMLANFEDKRRTRLADAMGNLAQMQSREAMQAEQLGISKAMLKLEQAKTRQTMRLQSAQAKKPGGALSNLPSAPPGYMWGGRGAGLSSSLRSIFSQNAGWRFR